MVRYYIKSGISKLGPFSMGSLHAMVKANQLQAIDMVSIDGISWIQARFIPDLFLGRSDIEGPIGAGYTNVVVGKYEVSDYFGVLKVLIPVCILMFLFGLFLGWINFSPDLKAIALVQETKDKLEAENTLLNESIRTTYFPKIDHQKEMDKTTAESEKSITSLQVELKKNSDSTINQLADLDGKRKKAVEEAKGFSKKFEALDEAILPFKELVVSLPDEPKLLELLTKLQNIPENDRNQAIINCLKALGELKGDEAQSLKFDYKDKRNRFTQSIAELIISWSFCVERLYSLSSIHKNTEACKSVMEDIRSGKDVLGRFMLEQFADLNKGEVLKLKIKSSMVGEVVKSKALVALEKAQGNASKVLEFLKTEFEGKPGVVAKQGTQVLQKKVNELIQDIAIKTRDEDPVRLEAHALQLETLSEVVKELVLLKAADKELGLTLKKYKFFVLFGDALGSKDLRAEFSKRTYDKAGNMSSRKPDDLKNHLESIAFSYQIVDIAGLVPVK